jgi:hypothetical protein
MAPMTSFGRQILNIILERVEATAGHGFIG